MTRGTGLVGQKGSLADLHELLKGHGYGYGYTREDESKREIIYLKGTGDAGISRLVMGRIAHGKPARRVNIRISPMLTQTREHGTPDVYRIFSERRRPRRG